MYRNKLPVMFPVLFVLVLSLVVVPWLKAAAYAEEKEDEKKPERLIVMAAEHPGVEIASDEDEVSIDLIFHNKGRKDETVEVWVAEKPENWKARIKTYQFTVMRVHVPADDDRTLTFEAEPIGDEARPGNYKFRVEAKTLDGKFKMAQDITIDVIEEKKKEGKKESKGVKLTTSYPVLRGPSDAKFEFSMDVDSKLDKEAVFDLMATGPEGWSINFKPAYEDKFISSLRLKEDGSKTVAVVVKPLFRAKAGEYPINVRVSSGNASAEAKLMVVLTGTYGLEVGTPSGALALDARKGKPANMSIYIKNTGTATNHNIKLASFAPENWKVAFEPEKIEAIEPGDLKQVEVIITPHEDATHGDYSVGVKVEGEKVSKPIDFRVTVHGSTAWGWIGIAAIIVIVIGLTGLFRWLGRR
ncbi:MAG: hypothetical protein JRI77_01660 [Deltaproteobacteria bacterium]|nr:hypothetical protein [Deltaproteobacteria bacterium]